MIWQYNEMIQAGADHSDVDRAKYYDDRMLKFRNYEQEAEQLFCRLHICKDHTVIDFGCGTGALTIEMAKRCKRVYAVDVSERMLAVLRQKAEKHGITNIHFVNAGYLTYEHRGEPVDVIVTKTALHHLPDFWKAVALNRMNGMLKKEGKLFLSDVIFSFRIKDYIDEINKFLHGIREAAGEELYNDGILHMKEEFSTFDWIMDEILRKTNFEVMQKDISSGTNIDYYCVKK